MDFVGFEAEGHGAGCIGDGDDVVEFGDGAFDAGEVVDVAGGEVDDVEAALGDGVTAGEFVGQGQSGKGAVAGLGESDDGPVVAEGHAAEIAGAEGDGFECAGGGVYKSEEAVPGVVDIKAAVVQRGE